MAESKGSTFKSLLLYGKPGKGKTWFAARAFGIQKKRLIIDTDRKFADSVKSMPGIQQLTPNVDIWMPQATISGDNKIGIVRIERFDQGKVVPGTSGFIPPDPRGYKEIVDFINQLLDMKPFPYEVVVEDSLTAQSEHLEASILNHHRASTFSLPLFGVYKRNMIEWKGGFMSLPCHRIAVAHEYEAQDELTKELQTLPAIVGSYREEIGKDFTEVYYFVGEIKGADGKDRYVVRTRASRRYIARTTLPDLAVEEDVEKVLAALEKSIS